ncbi:DUF1565 domain-containing protein [Pseudomonas sp. DCB_CB]|uniref:DUF1565 domain-containing protein n=1 Tax=unclassified Pseudomonas TaxID=196821 RepID=UPI002248A233|nr:MULTISPECIES: DUF1565 domain-containing protein [unclassified Pseudomonas]MCX2689617.1 DUF1565 domain-containing protein [Pseudomonas sp. DCB_BZ]MCX2854704.1 DUF1565 domain-containing protein [Pseudomonas sp. DCB_CB]
MSLESDVANLVTKAETLIAYFNGKKTSIDAAVAAAIAAVPETSRTWYVDQVVGSDANPGTQAAPFKTIAKAITSTPKSGICTVYVTNDYDMTVNIASACSLLYIIGVVVNGVKPKLKPKYLVSDDGSNTNMTGLNLYMTANYIGLKDFKISLPSPAGIVPAPNNTRAGAFFRGFSGVNIPASFNISLESVDVEKTADWFGSFIGLTSSSLVLSVNACTFPSDFAGRYVSNVAAGALTKDLGHVVCNLASL